MRAAWIVVVAALMLGGCDPSGPGASGSVALGRDVDPSAFQTLALRAFPNATGLFDPSAAIPAGPHRDEPLSSITFPHPYKVAWGIGTTDVRGWRFVAWLSRRAPGSVASLELGDVYCSVPFQVDGCFGQNSQCGAKGGVDCTVAERRGGVGSASSQ